MGAATASSVQIHLAGLKAVTHPPWNLMDALSGRLLDLNYFTLWSGTTTASSIFMSISQVTLRRSLDMALLTQTTVSLGVHWPYDRGNGQKLGRLYPCHGQTV
jgi:hypothetical protein